MSFLLDEHSLTYSGLKSKHFFGIASHSKISYFETGAAGEQCPYKELAGCALVAGGTSALVGGGEGFPNGLSADYSNDDSHLLSSAVDLRISSSALHSNSYLLLF